MLESMLEQLQRAKVSRIDLVYASATLQAGSGLPGVVHPSPIAVERFQPAAGEHAGFTVGRMSRDAREKHHPEDPALYRELAQAGCRVRIMGGERSLGADVPAPGVELLPECAEPAEEFLRSLDVFLFRTHPGWLETFARCVSEAMCCGLPVVCEDRGGPVDLVTHGRDGFLVGNTAQARDAVLRLKADAELRRRIGAAARATILRVYSPARIQELVAYYLD
jgi:glycosyltransferase involved in cell wall biosynthesis